MRITSKASVTLFMWFKNHKTRTSNDSVGIILDFFFPPLQIKKKHFIENKSFVWFIGLFPPLHLHLLFYINNSSFNVQSPFSALDLALSNYMEHKVSSFKVQLWKPEISLSVWLEPSPKQSFVILKWLQSQKFNPNFYFLLMGIEHYTIICINI